MLFETVQEAQKGSEEAKLEISADDPGECLEAEPGRRQGRDDAGVSGDFGKHELGKAAKPGGWRDRLVF